KDEDLVAKGKLADGEQLRFKFEERNGSVSRVVVENYREKSRLNEILNTVSWTFSIMLEKELGLHETEYLSASRGLRLFGRHVVFCSRVREGEPVSVAFPV